VGTSGTFQGCTEGVVTNGASLVGQSLRKIGKRVSKKGFSDYSGGKKAKKKKQSLLFEGGTNKGD